MTKFSPKDRSDRGRTVQAEVSGKPIVDPVTPLQESWRDFVFAEIWSRPGLERRARYLVAIAGSVMTEADDAILDDYVHGAIVSQHLSLLELREAALHLAVYGGWGRAQILDRAIDRVQLALNVAPINAPPIRADEWDPAVRIADGEKEFLRVMTYPGSPPVTPYLEAISNFVFGEMWCRPGLDQRSRRFLTLVAVAESSSEIPIKSHVHAAMASGNCTADEMQEFVLQYGVHSGWPKASVLQAAVMEMAPKVAAGQAWNA